MKESSKTQEIGLIILLMIFASTVGGCLGSPAPQDHYYRLHLPKADARFDPPVLNGTLQVSRPWADALTSERHLLFRQDRDTSQIRRHAYHRWADSPTLILQQEIARYLRDAHVARQVVTPEFRAKADYLLSCRIAKLERILDDTPRVEIELELGLTHTREREAVLLQTYQIEQPTHLGNIPASVAAYNQALSHILDQFLADVSNLPQSKQIHKHL